MDGPRGLRPDELDACLALVDRVFRSRPGGLQPLARLAGPEFSGRRAEAPFETLAWEPAPGYRRPDRSSSSRPARPAPTMRQEFPLLFDPANAGRLRVMLDGPRVVCHIGVLYQTILVGACELPVACVGAVCTDPAYRGRGLATATLADAIAMMRRDGRVLLLISGDRSLYRRQGCVHAGRRVVFSASAAGLAPLADPALVVRPRQGEADLNEMLRLYDKRPVRYARTPETLRRLLGGLEPYGNTTLMVERRPRRASAAAEPAAGAPRSGRFSRPACRALSSRGGAVVAYLVVRYGGPMAWWGPGVGRVMEYAGEPEAVVGALGPAADLLAVSQLSFPVHGGDEAILAALQSAGLESKEEGLTGIFCVLDAAGLVRRLGPWWRERLGEEVGASVEAVEENGEPTGLALAGRVLAVPGSAAFTRLLFSAEAPDGAAGHVAEVFSALQPALPVPLPDYGLNYV